MPYEVIMNADNCDGHAVVKVGSTMPVDGGCHATHQEALDQMTALNIATADERSQRNEDMNAAIDDAIELLMAAKAAHMEGQKELEDEMEDEPMDSSEMEDDDEYRAVNLVAPAFMRASAKRGLVLHGEGESGDGLVPATVADARRMANGEALSDNKWRKISPWIARHIVDLDAVQGDEITAGLVAMLLWGGGASKASARRAQAYAERIVSQLDNETRAPAPKKDQIKGSEKNPEGSAKGTTGGIVLNQATVTALDNKVKEHNQKMADRNRPDWTRTTVGALKAVYRRGAGAFSTSHRPNIGRAQWAMARVNAFLYLVRTGAPANPIYVTDNDLLKPSHPKYSGSSKSK
jgi:hypothetical protein